MAQPIPFVTGEEAAKLVKKLFSDSDVVRVPVDRATRLLPLLPAGAKIWMDPCVDGMDDVQARSPKDDVPASQWLEFMSSCAHFAAIADPSSHERPDSKQVAAFVDAILGRCATHSPAWITVPQLPLSDGNGRNKVNRALAKAAGAWKSTSGYAGNLILPLILTHQDQVNGKTARNGKVQAAARCYSDARADGFWVVDKTLADDNGSATLRAKRSPGIIDFHEELNASIPSKLRVGGPYWGLNLVLWARGLVDFPAIGVGSGYQHFLSGGFAKTPSAKIALPSLRRRVGVGQLGRWLDAAMARLTPTNPVHGELHLIRNQLTVLSQVSAAREQVARFYKTWCDIIEAAPKAGRSMALFQDFAAAYALGKALPTLPDEGTARRPEAVVEPLMLSCL